MTVVSHQVKQLKLGWGCVCGQKFPTEAAAQAHAADENKREENRIMADKKTKDAAAEQASAAFKGEDTPAQYKKDEEQIKANVAAPSTPEPPKEPAKPVAPTAEVKPDPKPSPAPAENGNSATPAPATPRATSKVQAFLDNADVRARFENLLDKRAGQFVTSLTALVSGNQKLAECSPQSFLSAAVTAAALDLPVNPNLGFAYIIPYNDKRLGMIAQFQMGYKGFIQLAQRSGLYKTIHATDVRQGEYVRRDRTTGEIIFDWNDNDAARAKLPVVGYLAYFRLTNGFEKFQYMSVDEASAHGKQYSQSFRKGYGLWQDQFDTMATKTVLKLLISKFGPLSTDAQMQMAVERDQAAIDDAEVTYTDNQPEIQDRIDAATTREQLAAIMDSLNGPDKAFAQPLIEARLAEINGVPFE